MKIMKTRLFLTMLSVLCLSFVPAKAETDKFRSTDLPLPRFVSLSSDKVYARTGPGKNYPIKWVYNRKLLPVEIVQEYEGWRKVKDNEGDGGWIHRSLLSGRRTALIRDGDPAFVYEKNNEKARVKARLEAGVVVSVDECMESWCRVEAGGYRGWVERKFLWGIYEGEEFD